MTDKTDIAALMRDMRDLADRIVECQGENSDGEEIIHLYDQSDTTFKAQNILLVLNAFEAERQRADKAQADMQFECDAHIDTAESWREWKLRAITAENKLAALKGDRVPVASELIPEGMKYSSALPEFVGDSNEISSYRCWIHANTRKVATQEQAYADAKAVCELFTAPQKPVLHPDTKRMDWLVSQHVEVRTPMAYGSHARFVAQCDSDDCEEYHTTLREQIDAAIDAAGGWVCTSDERLMQDMSGIVVEPNFREISNSSTGTFRENLETSTNCPKCGGSGSYHCPQMLGKVECECGGDHQSSAPAVLRDVLTAVSIGGSRTELIDALTAIKPKFGAPGSRDVDVRAAHVAIDKAIEKLSNL